MVIVPSIGRVVWFWPIEPVDQPYAALVTYVHSDRLINVGGFTANGEPFARTSIKLRQDGDPEAAPFPVRGVEAYAEWMPYQKQVASGAIPPTLHAQPDKAATAKGKGR
jgi:hypothetical protein